jgi:hypothetical protein
LSGAFAALATSASPARREIRGGRHDTPLAAKAARLVIRAG